MKCLLFIYLKFILKWIKVCIKIITGYEADDYKSVRLKIRGQSITIKLHMLNFLVAKNFDFDYDPSYDISHLCHLPSCVKPSHLNHESRSLNNLRKKCLKNLSCQGHGSDPDCIFD